MLAFVSVVVGVNFLTQDNRQVTNRRTIDVTLKVYVCLYHVHSYLVVAVIINTLHILAPFVMNLGENFGFWKMRRYVNG